MAPEKQKILFIVNPKAGVTIKSKFFISLLAGSYLNTEKYLPEVKFTKYAGHATELARDAAGEGAAVIVAVGGDGTVNEVASALVNTEIAMGILPSGSGNGLAHHLKIPMNLIKALMVINKGHTQMIDTVDINGKLFTSIAGIGFDARVAEKFALSGVRGLASYMWIILKEFRSYKPKVYKFNIRGEVFVREALMISFANSNQFGFHSRIAPQACIDDGILDICVVTKMPAHKIVFTAPRVFFGTFGKTGYAEYFRATELLLPGTAGSKVNIDGEAVLMTEDVKLKVNPLSLKVLVC